MTSFSSTFFTLSMGKFVYNVEKSKQLILLARKFLIFDINSVELLILQKQLIPVCLNIVLQYLRKWSLIAVRHNVTSTDNCLVVHLDAPAINCVTIKAFLFLCWPHSFAAWASQICQCLKPSLGLRKMQDRPVLCKVRVRGFTEIPVNRGPECAPNRTAVRFLYTGIFRYSEKLVFWPFLPCFHVLKTVQVRVSHRYRS